MAKTKEDYSAKYQEMLAAKGIALSKDKAWDAFKMAISAIVDSVVEDEDHALVLSGIGKFEIIKAAPRQSKIGVVDFVPRMRWRASVRIDEILENRLGQVPNPEKIAARKEEMKADGTYKMNLPPRAVSDPVPTSEKPAEPPKAKAPKASKPEASKPEASKPEASKPEASVDDFEDEFE